MKTQMTALVLSMLLGTQIAQAFQCTKDTPKRLVQSLQSYVLNKNLTQKEKEAVLFTTSILQNSRIKSCGFILGIGGEIYELETDTFKISIELLQFSGEVSSVYTQRTGFSEL